MCRARFVQRAEAGGVRCLHCQARPGRPPPDDDTSLVTRRRRGSARASRSSRGSPRAASFLHRSASKVALPPRLRSRTAGRRPQSRGSLHHPKSNEKISCRFCPAVPSQTGFAEVKTLSFNRRQRGGATLNHHPEIPRPTQASPREREATTWPKLESGRKAARATTSDWDALGYTSQPDQVADDAMHEGRGDIGFSQPCAVVTAAG